MAKLDIEVAKLFNDYIKHINTLTTGAIIVLVTFLEKVFDQPKSKWLVAFTLICCLLSLIGGVLVKTVFTFIVYNDSDDQEVPSFVDGMREYGIILCWLGFLIGMISLAIFGIINLF